jgi:ribonuclease D
MGQTPHDSAAPPAEDLHEDPAAPGLAAEQAGPEPVPLLVPRDGVPAVIASGAALAEAVAALAAGTGPVAVDAERASGYRFSQRAYLVQLRRQGAGTFLIDPIACPDLSSVNAVIADAEWVLHAANQDLPCLAEIGLRPTRLFDTELAGRLAHYERVGLGPLVERVLGYRLEKGHSAADWSTRPLPEPWLRYAALDVELLVELRDALEGTLAAQGKLEWAHEEFAAIVAAPPPPPREEPWRRTSGIHRLRSTRQLAAVRALWQARDAIARRRDVAPGRVLPDSAIIAAVLAAPATVEELAALPVFSGPRMRRSAGTWFGALRAAAALDAADLPQQPRGTGDAPPPGNRWADRDPVAAGRLNRVRAAVAALAEQLDLPTENLCEPAVLRRLAWAPPPSTDATSVAAALARHGARPWQVSLVADGVAAALAEPPTAENDAEDAASAG